MVEAKRMVAGFNHNVRHAGKLYHVQTEDSGVGSPRITTHLFVGGNIIASKTTSYADILAAEDLASTVRSLMEEQHKAILRNLVNGVYDEADAAYGEKARAYQPGQLAIPEQAPAGELVPAAVPLKVAVPAPPAARAAAPTTTVPPRAAAAPPISDRGAPAFPGAAARAAGVTAPRAAPATPPVRPASSPALATPRSAPPPPAARSPGAPPARAAPPPVPATARPISAFASPGPPPHHKAVPRSQMPALTPPPVLRRYAAGAPASAPPAGSGSAPTATPHPAVDEPLDTLLGEDLVGEKSLDEVILSYLAEDPRERK